MRMHKFEAVNVFWEGRDAVDQYLNWEQLENGGMTLRTEPDLLYEQSAAISPEALAPTTRSHRLRLRLPVSRSPAQELLRGIAPDQIFLEEMLDKRK